MQGAMDLSLVNWVLLKCGAFILLLMHSMYTFFSFILDCLLNILKHFKAFYSRTQASKSMSETFLQEQLKCYSKIPKHLVVIIEEEDISYHDCVKLILWCLNSGIPFISFYSFSSAINPTSLYEVLCKRSKTSLQNIKWGNSFHKSVKEMAKKDINGYVWTPVTEVNMFSSKSVYESMENVMLSLCQQGMKSEQITIDTIDKKFKTEVPLPDPCLALVFGKTFSTFGFMPWQIRVTEFSHMLTHHNLQVEDFLNALRTYTSCDQRFGK